MIQNYHFCTNSHTKDACLVKQFKKNVIDIKSSILQQKLITFQCFRPFNLVSLSWFYDYVMHARSISSYECTPQIFTALYGMQTRSSDENSVCLSVCLSVCPSVRPSVTRVNCDNTVERSVQIYIPYERTFSLVLSEEEWLVGWRPIPPKILGQPAPVGAKSPILNR